MASEGHGGVGSWCHMVSSCLPGGITDSSPLLAALGLYGASRHAQLWLLGLFSCLTPILLSLRSLLHTFLCDGSRAMAGCKEGSKRCCLLSAAHVAKWATSVQGPSLMGQGCDRREPVSHHTCSMHGVVHQSSLAAGRGSPAVLSTLLARGHERTRSILLPSG